MRKELIFKLGIKLSALKYSVVYQGTSLNGPQLTLPIPESDGRIKIFFSHGLRMSVFGVEFPVEEKDIIERLNIAKQPLLHAAKTLIGDRTVKVVGNGFVIDSVWFYEESPGEWAMISEDTTVNMGYNDVLNLLG